VFGQGRHASDRTKWRSLNELHPVRAAWRRFAQVSMEMMRRMLSAEHFTVDGTLIEAWVCDFPHTLRDNNP
jgi:hypothetical protein